MFSIEHEFDATVIILVDDFAASAPVETPAPLQEDVIINAFEECVTISQFDPRLNETRTITLSMSQLRDLRAALNLPEGVYTRSPPG